jgi:tetratricopeptide (TPR) repeat protein
MGDKEKKIFLFFLIIFFGFCALFATEKIADPDFWWHLKTGEWIWHNKAIPHTDPFSYTFRGAEWINYEWLFHAIIYPIYKLGRFGGLIVFEIIIALITFLILFFACREVDGGKKWLTITILFVALLVVRGRFAVRPQIISFFLLALYLYLLILHRGERITTRQLIFFLVPAHILWVNIHGSFLLGIFLAGAYALGRFIPLVLVHHRDLTPVFQDRKLQGLVVLCLCLCLASLVNPFTYRIFFIPLKTAASEEILRGISEWVPVDIKFLGAFAIEYTMWFRILFLIGAASFLIWRDNLKRVEDIVIFAIFSYMAFKHVRFGGEFAIAAAPIVVNNLNQFRYHARGWSWIRFLPLFVITVFSINEVRTLVRMDLFGFGVWRNHPERTVNFLKEHDIKGKIFNTYGYGGYLIWHLWPDIPVFIDGRAVTIYDQDFFWLCSLAYRKKEIWEEVVKRYGIEIVLVQDERERGYSSLFYWLDEDKNWRLVAFDDNSNLYLKRGGRFDGLIQKYGFHYLRPADVSMDYAKEKKKDLKYLKALETELEKACQRFSKDFYSYYYLGVYHQIYGTKAHFLEAEKALRRAVANRPDLPRGYYELGFTLMKLERYNEAVGAFKQSIRLSSNLPPDAYYYLGLSLFNLGKMTEAITFLEKYKERTEPATRVEAYKFLGRAYLRKYKLEKALSCFKREEYLEKPTWETFLNMGVAYFGLGKFNNAKECFERALEMRLDSLKVIYNLAIVYERLGRKDESKKLFEKASQMTPQTPEEGVWVQKAKEQAK